MQQFKVQQVPEDRILVGQLRSAYGLNGWFWVYSNTTPISNIFDYLPWYLQVEGDWYLVHVKRWKPQGKGIVASLKEFDDRTSAERLIGAEIWISKSNLPALTEDEYYWNDLKGLTVMGYSASGEVIVLGHIHDLFETGANDVMIVHADQNSIDDQERLIPWHRDIVEQVDLNARTIHLDWRSDY